MTKNDLFECLKSIDEECAVIEQKSDGNYHVICKKRLINNDGSDAGWLYADIPNARLDEKGRYTVEPPKEDKIGNRAERRRRSNGRQDF